MGYFGAYFQLIWGLKIFQKNVVKMWSFDFSRKNVVKMWSKCGLFSGLFQAYLGLIWGSMKISRKCGQNVVKMWSFLKAHLGHIWGAFGAHLGHIWGALSQWDCMLFFNFFCIFGFLRCCSINAILFVSLFDQLYDVQSQPNKKFANFSKKMFFTT